MKMELFVHIGLPKTGTTAIQNALFSRCHELRNAGALYPESGLLKKNRYGANHQFLMTCLLNKDMDLLSKLFDDMGDEAASKKCNKIIISHEGMTNHYYDFNIFFIDVLNYLSSIFQVKIIIVVRPLVDFFFSYYKQNISNPPINDALGFGSDLTPFQFFQLPRIKKILNYDQILGEINLLSLNSEIFVLRYGKELLVKRFIKILGVNIQEDTKNLENESLSDHAIEVIRGSNRVLKGNTSERKTFIDAIRNEDKYYSGNFKLYRNPKLIEELESLDNDLHFKNCTLL